MALGTISSPPLFSRTRSRACRPARSPVFPASPLRRGGNEARTPIKHVIVIIGENRSFDHVFATYVPNQPGETVNNLLSRASSGWIPTRTRFRDPTSQRRIRPPRRIPAPSDPFLLSPPQANFPNNQLPAPLVGGPKVSYIPNECGSTPITSARPASTLAQQSETGLPSDYYQYPVERRHRPDLANPRPAHHQRECAAGRPFQLTNGTMLRLRRLCGEPGAPLLPDVAAAELQRLGGQPRQSVGLQRQPVLLGRSDRRRRHQRRGAARQLQHRIFADGATTTGEGSTALGFYNVQKGDVPYFTGLAQKYAMSDNFHQSVNGGTGANHIMFGHADMIWFSDANGNPAVPPNGDAGLHRHAGCRHRQPDREPEPGDRHQQLVHRGRLRRSYKAAIRRLQQPGLRRRLLHAIAPTPRSPAWSRSRITCKSLPRPSTRTAKRATTIS